MSVLDMAVQETEAAPGGKRRKLVVLVVLALAVATATWWFMVRPAGADEAPRPGEVLKLDPIQVNLAGGHYLKVGIALQAVDGAEEVEGSKALDATIELFSGATTADLADRRLRQRYKARLLEELEHRYHGEVMEVYFTDFVTQ